MSATETTTEPSAPRTFSLTALTGAALIGLIIGVTLTVAVTRAVAPPPQALVAQVGNGTVLTAPTA